MRRAGWSAVLPLALAGGAWAQTIDGEVVDRLTGAPLAGAYVSARCVYNPDTVVTDAAGRFHMALTRWCGGLSLGRPGYVSRKDLPLNATPGEHIAGVRLTMTPQAVISGRILDQEGFPVEGAAVGTYAGLSGGGKPPRWEARGGGISNDRGEYRIAGLHAGRYYVQVAHAGDAAKWHGPYLAQFYPSAASREEATPIEVRAGEERGDVHFRLVRREGVTVSGRVEWPAGVDSRTYSLGVTLTSEDYPGLAPLGCASPDGSFTLAHVAPGRYRVYVHRENPGAYETVTMGSQEVAVGASGVSGVVVTAVALRQRDVAGRVEMPAGETRRPEKIELRVMNRYIYSGVIDAEGAFTIKNIAPDRYSVHAMLPVNNGDVEESQISVTAGGQEMDASRLPVDGELAGPIVVRVQGAETGKAELSLRLTDAAGAPVAGGVVLLQGTVKQRRMAIPVDLAGVQHQLGIEPDDYLVYAVEEMDSEAVWDDAEFMAAHLTSPTPVHLSPGQNAPLVITLRTP